ncbi:MAG: UbiA family prenyltransferase [Candidatus Bathyarchaeota archaeon]|nr:UbiA family prenyltransferase [Candidatus Bathyarchaeum tardum]
MKAQLKSYFDLTRVHFFFVWPTLFCAGVFLGFQLNAIFSWSLILRAIFIGLAGFEAGLVLNDIIDRDIDKKEVETNKLTKYWRVFGQRPLSQGLLSYKQGLIVFFGLVAVTTVLIFTFPFPTSLYLVTIMLVCYGLEIFYQIKKRNQSFPFAQLIGRIDFTMFPVAGYIAVAGFDFNALLFGLFFYPLAQAHLGVNDMADVTNDKVKNMKTIPLLYEMKGTSYWILLFSALHIGAAIVFVSILGTIALIGFSISFVLLTLANYKILKGKTADSAMKALPLFHVSMLIYAISIIAGYFI